MIYSVLSHMFLETYTLGINQAARCMIYFPGNIVKDIVTNSYSDGKVPGDLVVM